MWQCSLARELFFFGGIFLSLLTYSISRAPNSQSIAVSLILSSFQNHFKETLKPFVWVQATKMEQMRDADGRWSSSPTTGVSDRAFLVASNSNDGGSKVVVVVVISVQQRVRSVFQRLGFRHESLAATNIDY
ncbi:hypothetical protein HanIR_Chr02g0084791 [Helianthus annuus]|nr:hypothetical protein HanIR_Chr02g0084791 [Helianthus annuus]